MKTFLFTYLLIVFGFSVYLFQDPSLEASIQRGSEIYADFCVTCHLAQGEGVANTFPPLAKSDYLIENREGSIKGVKFGQKGALVVNGITYNSVMAPLGLEDGEVADVMNFILNSWGNTSERMVTVEEVQAVQKDK